jgi:H/ACA ribonucleoprotein complex subunit 3
VVWLLRHCTKCDRYTLKTDACPKCGGPVKIPHPPKFSLDDKYRKYRIEMRRMAREKDENKVSA